MCAVFALFVVLCCCVVAILIIIELIDRREGVLWKQKRSYPQTVFALFVMKSFCFTHQLCSRHFNGCFW